MKRNNGGLLFCVLLAAGLLAACLPQVTMPAVSHKTYTAADFGIATVKSAVDFNQNGIDDYADFVLGARKDAERKPKYDGSYYVKGGFPPENIGVCTDLVWRAFREAGYDLKAMVDADIAAHTALYPRAKTPDPNIDFRRVKNLHVFFGRYALSLTTDLSQIDQFQPGDIVVVNDQSHIGIISDKRNEKGEPYFLHNAGQWEREEDALARWSILAHYRFDASRLPPGFIAAFLKSGQGVEKPASAK